MALDPSQQAMHDDSPVKTPAFSPKNGNGLPSPSANPEVLRWRAEVLLDEMMLGGVDVAAGEPGQRPFRASATPSPATLPAEFNPDDETSAASAYTNGHSGDVGARHELEQFAEPKVAPQPPSSDARPTRFSGSERAAVNHAALSNEERSVDPAPAFNEPESAQPWVLSAEERYRNLARQQGTAELQSPATPARNAQGLYEWPESPDPSERVEAAPATEDLSTLHPRAVRRTSAHYATNINTTGGAKRSNLLPRQSAMDVEAVQREIYTLQNEIDLRLPLTHESNKRAHHLLEKALTIVQADPTRSAEVEYYLQQVRTIFQRVQQTIDWSSIYRNRLSVYLSAWTVLALIVLAAAYLYPAQLENSLVLYGSLAPDGAVIQQAVMDMASLMAGALGGALGIFFSLHHQSRIPHGFIDRKFGLRGLILPLIGALVGFGLAVVVGLVYYFLGLNPTQNLLLSIVPAFLAFGFGVSQELLYGTRD